MRERESFEEYATIIVCPLRQGCHKMNAWDGGNAGKGIHCLHFSTCISSVVQLEWCNMLTGAVVEVHSAVKSATQS